jgi:hypothetical protein
MKTGVTRWLRTQNKDHFNPLNAELNPICHLLALLGAHHILHVSRVRVNIVRTVHHVLHYPFVCPVVNYTVLLYLDCSSLKMVLINI